MARACRFTAPYGSREIYHDGKPFIQIHRALNKFDTGSSRPVDVDDTAREILSLLCGMRKKKSALAGLGIWPFKKKPKINPMTKRMIWVPGEAPRVMSKDTATSAMTRQGRQILGRSRKRRRR